MAFQIGSNTVINNSRKGIFLSTNPGVYTNATRPASPSTGDIIYNSDASSLQVWTGSTWKNAGGAELTAGSGGNSTTTYTDPAGLLWRVHVFTSPGTFTLTSVGSPQLGDLSALTSLVVGGGGGGGRDGGAGGGGGGLLQTVHPAPTLAPFAGSGIPITVGSGGNGGLANPGQGSNGGSSSFGTLSSVAGGGGGGSLNKSDPTARTANAGSPGGSGGGGGAAFRQARPGGQAAAGSPGGQGNPGGGGSFSYDSRFSGGGGGGANFNAQGGNASSPTGGNGGAGFGISNLPPAVGAPGPNTALRYFGGGGGGNGWNAAGSGGIGGGGNACRAGNTTPAPTNLTLIKTGVNGTGGGGGGSTWGLPTSVNRGGNGIVIIKYRVLE
jgi:hypothetical protein